MSGVGPPLSMVAKRDNETAARTGPELRLPSEADSLRLLGETVEELNSTLDLGEVLRRLAERVRQFLDYDTFAILLTEPSGESLQMRFCVGYPPEVQEGFRLGIGEGIVGAAARSGHPVRVGDVCADQRYINAGEEIRSELAVPLKVRDRTIGVLDVGSRRTHRFAPEHERLLVLLAERIAPAIENARLYESVREQARTLSLLHEVSSEITSILEREELLRRIAELVKKLVDYQLFSVLLWNEETDLLEHVFSLQYDRRFSVKTGFPLGYGLCGAAAALRRPIRVSDVSQDPRYVHCAHQVEVRSELVVPLLFKERLIGVLDLESVEFDAFTEQHEQTLSTLASYIAIALENARLYELLRREEERLEEDLVAAREVQKSLLSRSVITLPEEIAVAYEPARELGGDFYDFLPYGPEHVAIAVGDVSGKATPAALFGALAIGILRGRVVQEPSQPKEMLRFMNDSLRHSQTDGRYVAMALGVYDRHKRALVLSNAGLPPPLLIRADTIRTLYVTGIPLGLFPGTRYDQESVQLQPEDIVVFLTDGVLEAMNEQEEEFGRSRVATLVEKCRALSPLEIAKELLRAASGHLHAPEQADDRTVVVLKVR